MRSISRCIGCHIASQGSAATTRGKRHGHGAFLRGADLPPAASAIA
jgi:hypothetical protein